MESISFFLFYTINYFQGTEYYLARLLALNCDHDSSGIFFHHYFSSFSTSTKVLLTLVSSFFFLSLVSA